MSSGALYRKYRSKSFREVIGQEHITTTLLNSIKNNSFAHAYLLTGPRGVGKTSIARLFAAAVNDIDYDNGKTYSDIIEIDAASNRRIDEIRELREKVSIAPSMLKYKVYIIDEVHMLTKEAFNALLKTLEEPPEHVIFILATTDAHKVPATIISRCVNFSFMAIPSDSIKKHLSKIAKQESIDIEEAALGIIADNSDGSFRDAISFLDQFRHSKASIKAEYVAAILGIGPKKEIAGLVASIEDSKPKAIVEALDRLRAGGSNDAQIVKQLINYLRSCLLGDNKSKLSNGKILSIIDQLLKVNDYSNIHLALEIALIGAVDQVEPPQSDKPIHAAKQSSELKEPEPKASLDASDNTDRPATEASNANLWDEALDLLRSTNNTLYAVARMAEAKHIDRTLELYFKFPFHYKQMNLEKNHLQVEKTVKSLDGSIEKVSLFIQNGSADQLKEPIKNISNIFGPSEVLES